MTVFEKIIEAIRPFGYPYTAGVYEGKEKDGLPLIFQMTMEMPMRMIHRKA